MSGKTGSYQIIDLPPARRLMVKMLNVSAPKHCMYGLLEVDVTLARQFIEDNRARTGERLSFTGYLVYCLARAVDENKSVQAYLKGRKQLVLFDDVDVGLAIEQRRGEELVPTAYVVRAANRKRYRQIHHEIRTAQATPAPDGGIPAWFQSVMLLPWPLSALSDALLRLINRRDPTIYTSLAGTVGISAVGMFGAGQGGWGLFPLANSLSLIVGSTVWKSTVVAGQMEPREVLDLTVVFDHDVVDGAPAARFARRLVELIESGDGLEEEQPAHQRPYYAAKSEAI